MTKPLIELVEEYRDSCQVAYTWNGTPKGEAAMRLRDAALSELRTRLEALERDAARFQHLQNADPKVAQAFFWTYSSRTERRKAIDAAMTAAAAIATQEGD